MGFGIIEWFLLLFVLMSIPFTYSGPLGSGSATVGYMPVLHLQPWLRKACCHLALALLVWNAWQENIQHTIASGASYNESFRVTCPNVEGAEEYCADYDKLRGQGVSLKIFTAANLSEALQFEYALVQNPLDELPYHKLNYDVSLLDCADPLDHALLYGIGFNTENHREITDQSMSAEDRKHKVDLCPGYKGGLRVSFKAEESCDGDICEPIDCNEDDWCKIYFFQRTRDGEPSLSCGGEFRGNVVLDLCVASAGANINTEAGSK
ncbi:unnamed protein product [Alternaria burnsii]|nr:unnamed protein product [Alternaria burnsii]